MTKVVFITKILPHYRIAFHDHVRTKLAARGVDYDLVYGLPTGGEAAKGDVATLPWATQVRNRIIPIRGTELVWQPVLGHLQGADLVVIGQENMLLANYVLQGLPRFLRPRIAFWGHGRNFQSRRPNGPAERWKRFWATRCDWWFAYTEESRRHVQSLGFPVERITSCNNAVDTSETTRLVDGVSEERIEARRRDLRLVGNNVGIFVGGLYPDKRLEFLVEAARRIRLDVEDFELIVVGGGSDAAFLAGIAADKPWIKVVGPRFGADKAELMRLARIFLMPGLLGLAILDAAAAGLPTVTTAFPFHSPEIAYLQNGVNGVIVSEWKSSDRYADAVIGLLHASEELRRMSDAARETASYYTIEAMAERFVAGAIEALGR